MHQSLRCVRASEQVEKAAAGAVARRGQENRLIFARALAGSYRYPHPRRVHGRRCSRALDLAPQSLCRSRFTTTLPSAPAPS